MIRIGKIHAYMGSDVVNVLIWLLLLLFIIMVKLHSFISEKCAMV